MKYRKIKAKFQSTCSRCRNIIRKGEIIYWKKRSPVFCCQCGLEHQSETEYQERNEDRYLEDWYDTGGYYESVTGKRL